VLESKAILWRGKPCGRIYAAAEIPTPGASCCSTIRDGTPQRYDAQLFATLAGKEPNRDPGPVGRGHRHSSGRDQLLFPGCGGKSVVDGGPTNGRRRSDALGAELSEHAHYVSASPVGNTTLTVQDHPLHIGMESLIWQEEMDGPILTLGSQAGSRIRRPAPQGQVTASRRRRAHAAVKSSVAPRRASA